MVEFIVMEKTADGELSGMGQHEFRIAPRTGEYIEMNDSEGIGQTYVVLAVLHAQSPAPTAGDLIVKHVGDSTSFRNSL